MRLVLCILLAVLLPGSTFAAKRTLSLSQAHVAAERGDPQAAAALATTVDRVTCLNGCANRGYDTAQCADACRPGLCHPEAEQPYCVGR
jgi:hypothetical protein